MSTVAAILPAKHFETAKQRLSPMVQLGTRRALVESMFSDAMLALRRVPSIDQIFVVTSDPVAAQIEAQHPQGSREIRTSLQCRVFRAIQGYGAHYAETFFPLRPVS